jgi:hypothetical protein
MEIRRLHEEAAKLHSESVELRQENARVVLLRDEAAQLRTENADLRAEAAALRAEGASLRHENAELRGEGVALRRSHEQLQCERSALSYSFAQAQHEAEMVKDCKGGVSCIDMGLSGGSYCWPEEQQMRWRLRQTGGAEETEDEMKLGDVVHFEHRRIQAGDPIQDVTAWIDPAILCCPSPTRQAQRMRPTSAGSVSDSRSMFGFVDGTCMSGISDLIVKRAPVPPLLIPDPGVPVQDQYEKCDSESEEEEDEYDVHEKDEDEHQKEVKLKQEYGPLLEPDTTSSMLSRIPHQSSGRDAGDSCRNRARTASDILVTEPCGSSARPPRAKGSHSLEVRPTVPMC